MQIDLSATEKRILEMIVGNMSDVEIAFALDMEHLSVEKVNQQIFRKLGAADRAAASDLAVKLELVKLEL